MNANARAFPSHTETLWPFVAHGSRPAAGASASRVDARGRAMAPQERRAAVAACRESVKDGLALPSAGEAVLGKAAHAET